MTLFTKFIDLGKSLGLKGEQLTSFGTEQQNALEKSNKKRGGQQHYRLKVYIECFHLIITNKIMKDLGTIPEGAKYVTTGDMIKFLSTQEE